MPGLTNAGGEGHPPPKKPRLTLPPEEDRNIITPDGDLHLLVGPYKIELRVSSAVLTLASPVFKTMLTGPWVEKKPAMGKWAVELPEDDSMAVKLIMEILHLKFDIIPKRVLVQDLFHVCTFLDKYKLVKYVQPWAKGWCAECRSQDPCFAGRLWIGWVLGDRTMFERIANVLVCSLSGDSITDRDEREFGGISSIQVESIGVFDDIMRARDLALERFPSELRELQRRLFSNQICKVNNRGTVSSTDCDTFKVGSFVKALLHHDLFPIPGTVDDMSPIQRDQFRIFDVVQKIQSDDTLPAHRRCGLKDSSHSLSVFLEKRFFVLSREQARHLYEQAGITGLTRVVWE